MFEWRNYDRNDEDTSSCFYEKQENVWSFDEEKKMFICKKKQRKVKIILFKAPISLNIEVN